MDIFILSVHKSTVIINFIVCDFGSSIKFLKNNQKKKLKKPFGTPYYKAPEILENKEYEGDKIDIFSMGALLFVLMTKNFAFVEAKSMRNFPLSIWRYIFSITVANPP